MPLYDVKCDNGHEDEQFLWRSCDTLRPCATCGANVERTWGRLSAPHVVADSIPGGMTIENMGHEPMTFYSKSEWRHAMKERGLVNQVRHVGKQGSDKSDHTTRWV